MIDDIVLNKVESIERCIQKKHGMTIFLQFTSEIIRSLSNNESTKV